MTKLHFTIMLLGSFLFFWDISYGFGWLLGWLFIGILRHYRTRLLDRVIDFEDFSVARYMLYLFGIIVWIAIPLAISVFLPEYVNPFAIFGVYFIDRILLFATDKLKRGE